MIEPSGLWTPNKFHIKKYSEVVIPLSGHIGFGGLFRIETFNVENGMTRWLTPWFHNNITNVGLNMCATSAARYNCCQVGTGTAAPTNADTTLQTYHAGTDSRVYISGTNSGSPYYYSEDYVRYNFATGAATGNLSEVGIGPSTSSGSNLFSRELIRDANGNPTTITIASNEAIRVHYKLRHYPPLIDVVTTVNGTIDGTPSTRTITRRASDVDTYTNWVSGYNLGNASLFGGATDSSGAHAYTGTIGSITGGPSGSSYASTSQSTATYSSGSYSRTRTATWNTITANANIKSVIFANANVGNRAGIFQAEFNTTLNKTSLQQLTLEFRISWGRYTP